MSGKTHQHISERDWQSLSDQPVRRLEKLEQFLGECAASAQVVEQLWDFYEGDEDKIAAQLFRGSEVPQPVQVAMIRDLKGALDAAASFCASDEMKLIRRMV